MTDVTKVKIPESEAKRIADAKKARRVGGRAVARMLAFGEWVNVKADRGQESIGLTVQAFAEDGRPVADVDIVFRVVQPDSTGTGFIAEGIPDPVPSTVATTRGGGGSAQIYEPLRLGQVPGHVVIRAEPIDDQFGKVYADFQIEIADQLPARINLIKGGSQSFPAGQVHALEVVVQVVDASEKPVDFGTVRLFVPEEDRSGSFLVGPDGGPAWFYGDCDEGGEVKFAAPLYVGTKAPGEFKVRAQRLGMGPLLDIPYIAVQLGSGTSDTSASVQVEKP